jgi:hypothetical protein
MVAQIAQRPQEKVVMRKLFALLFTLGVTFCTAATAHAQVLKVNVPFDFVVDGKILPAATYTVLRSLPSDVRGLAFMGDVGGLQTIATEFDGTVTGNKLVFHRVGDQYFLKEVVTSHGKLHFAVSRKEAELARIAEGQSLRIINAN